MDDEEEITQPTFNIGDLINVPVPKESKFSHEYQELCTELEPFYGKVIWTLPYKAGFTEYKIRKAHDIAVSMKKVSIGYLMGIVKKLP